MGDILEFLSTNETRALVKAFRGHPEIVKTKVMVLLTENRLLMEKMNDIAVYLADFLSLNSSEEYEEVFNKNAANIENEIRRLLYRSPEKLGKIAGAYTRNYGDFVDVNRSTMSQRNESKRKRPNTTCGLEVEVPSFNTTGGEASVRNTKGDKTDTTDRSASTFNIFPFHVQTQHRATEDKEIKVVSETSAGGLQFLDVPTGDDMRIYNLKMDEEFLLFGALSKLMAYLQPGEFPLGLVKEALRSHVSFHILVLQILKLEGLVLSWILFWAILSLCLPFAVIAQLCCPKRNVQRLRDDSSDASSHLNNKCTGRTAGFMLCILLLLLPCCLLLMLITNDKLSGATEKLPATSSAALRDLETFIKNTQMQISFAATTSFDLALEEIDKDLNDVKRLFGKSFQRDLIRDTGIDKTKESLLNLRSSSAEISQRVRELLKECVAAENASKLLQGNLSELSRQLQQARQSCVQKDRASCEFLQFGGLAVVFSTEELLADTNLKYLEHICQDNDFNSGIEEVLQTFNDIPQYITLETSSRRAEIQDVLQKRRKQMYNSVRSLEEMCRSMTVTLRTVSQDISHLLDNISSGDLWRYLTAIGTSLVVFLVWILTVFGSPCGCHYTNKTMPSLTLGIFLASTISVVVWLFGSLYFTLGGHGQTLVCNALYEDDFTVLAGLLDKDGLIYEEGFFGHVLRSNDSIRIEDVLRNCHRDQPSFTTFHLQNHIDVNSLANYQTWSDLKGLFEEFSVNIDDLKISSVRLESRLQEYSTSARMKFKEFRANLLRPLVQKDLKAFLEQLDSVAARITDTKSAANFEKIVFKTRDIISRELRAVQDRRDSLLYKITALEILLQPLTLQCELLIRKLHEAQVVIDEQGPSLADKNARNYIFRLERNLDELRKYANDQIRKKIGKCKPVWDVFYYSRHHVCKLLVDPMATILIFLGMAPIIISLIKHYNELEEELFTSLLTGDGNEGLTSNDQGIWTSPTEGSSADGTNTSINEGTGWSTPRPPSDSGVPSPPRLPSETRASSPRLPSESVSRISSPRGPYDSLKLIERTSKMPR